MIRRTKKSAILDRVRHHDSTETRASILKAAERIYAEDGLAGARTTAIAAAAGVNKALLYYYFKSKEALYQAVVGSDVKEFQRHAEQVLSAKGPAGPILLRYVSYHFDFIGTHPHYPRIFQRMMMEGDRNLERLIREYSIPLRKLLVALLERGMRSGEFRRLDRDHAIVSIAGLTVHYFNLAPAVRMITGQDPFSKANLAKRKAEVLRFIRHALFRNPEAVER
ncbi:MAG: TetR family transcriptional regulator [Terriglobia bacterium]|jgi:TetR/AcrR family transcriptional regulator